VAAGRDAWSSAAWREAALAWVREHVVPTGAVEQTSLRPWATVLRVPTADGPVWMKAAAPSTAFEVPLYGVLASTVPERVLTPIAVDVERSWLLLPDGGPSLGEQDAGIEPLVAALGDYGRMQRQLERGSARCAPRASREPRPTPGRTRPPRPSPRCSTSRISSRSRARVCSR
jgi:hypothetical protein